MAPDPERQAGCAAAYSIAMPTRLSTATRRLRGQKVAAWLEIGYAETNGTYLRRGA